MLVPWEKIKYSKRNKSANEFGFFFFFVFTRVSDFRVAFRRLMMIWALTLAFIVLNDFIGFKLFLISGFVSVNFKCVWKFKTYTHLIYISRTYNAWSLKIQE